MGNDSLFPHPYLSWKRPQNEKNGLLRRLISKGKSINNYSTDGIVFFFDELNTIPWRILSY